MLTSRNISLINSYIAATNKPPRLIMVNTYINSVMASIFLIDNIIVYLMDTTATIDSVVVLNYTYMQAPAMR